MNSLLFIYNAKSGFANTIKDISNKLFSPDTYPCNLCAVTYNTFTENKIWKDFREQSNINMKFYHIDEFEKKYPNQTFSYPTILVKEGRNLHEFLIPEEINSVKNTEELITIIRRRFKNQLAS